MAPKPAWLIDGVETSALPARQAFASLIGAAGGTVGPTGLAVTQKGTPDMHVIVQGGTIEEGALWIPGTVSVGRQGIYFCLAGETGVLTRRGIQPIRELAGTSPELLTVGDRGPGRWVTAPIRSFGVQPLSKISLTRHGERKVIHATAEHRWIVIDSSKNRRDRRTSELRHGDSLASAFPQPSAITRLSAIGIAHGATFGDGTIACDGGRLDLWGDSIELLRYFAEPITSALESKNGVPGIQVRGLPCFFKDTPSLDESTKYLHGWLAGYFAADGHVRKDGHPALCSVSRANLEYVRAVATRLGIGTYGIREYEAEGFGGRRTMYSVSFVRRTLSDEFFLLTKHRERFIAGRDAKRDNTRWVVESVEPTDRAEEVFCAVVDGTHMFTLEDNILTGNCWNDANYEIPVSASDATNPRIDAVYAIVKDKDYEGSEAAFVIEVVKGTAKAGATLANLSGAPAAPKNSYLLAYVLVPANATSIVTADIKDEGSPVGSGPFLPVSVVSVETTAESGRTYLVGGTATINLPAPSATATISVYTGVSSTATIARSGSASIYGDFISGATSITLAALQHVILNSDGSNWFIVAGEPKREATPGGWTARTPGTEYEASATRPVFVRILVEGKASTSLAYGLTVAGVGDPGETVLPAISGGKVKITSSFWLMPGQKWKAGVGNIEALDSSYLAF